MKNIKKI